MPIRAFGKPMGIAADRSRRTIGGTNMVWNVPAVAPKLSMRLFRQTRRGNWAGVMARVAEALEHL